jgi:hypothetical protein
MDEVPELPAQTIEEAPAKPERLMEIVIRVCEQHGFPRAPGKRPHRMSPLQRGSSHDHEVCEPLLCPAFPLFPQWKDLPD